MNQTEVKTYYGNQPKAAEKFQADANKMSELSYYPVSQSYQDSRWGFFGILLAGVAIILFLLGLVAPTLGTRIFTWIFALIAFSIALVVRRSGALTVTYGYRE